jgi:hypothetical protein
MVSVTIEYVILIPLLFTQVIVFPLVASTMTNSWQESQRNVALQDVANNLASNIQQLYLTVNRDEILAGNVNQASKLPMTVASYPYTATASLSSISEPGSVKMLIITITLDELDNTVSASALLGPNVEWIDSTLRSNSADASINVQKFSNSTLSFSFGG